MEERNSLHVVSIGTWFVLAFLILLLIGLVIWFCFGSINMTLTRPGAMIDEKPLCPVYYNSSSAILSDLSISEGDFLMYGMTIGHVRVGDEIRSVYSPCEGYVVTVDTHKNQAITPDTILARIARTDHTRSEFVMTKVALDDLPSLYVGMPVTVRHTERGSDYAISGFVHEIFSNTDWSDSTLESWIGRPEAVRFVNDIFTISVPVSIVLFSDEYSQFKTEDGQKVNDSFLYGEMVEVEFLLSTKRPVDILLQK